MPDYYITFSAIVSSVLTLSYPDMVVDRVATVLFDNFNVEEDVRDFIRNDYLPEVTGLSCQIGTRYTSTTLLMRYSGIWDIEKSDWSILENSIV